MALRENKAKKTPEEIKKARAVRIKARAEMIYAHGISVMLTTQGAITKMTSLANREEELMQYIRSKGDQWAETSVLLASRFDNVWKKRRGEFLHDDA